MAIISGTQVIKWLNNRALIENIQGKIDGVYQIASLFKPISYGFYFLEGDVIPDTISQSLIITSKKDLGSQHSHQNSIILVKRNAQQVFYELLNDLFSSASNGKIASTAIIHPEAIIGENVQIDDFAIVGKATIGENTLVRSHCYIHDGSVLGNSVTIEPHSVIGAQGVAWIWNDDETEKIVQPQLGGVAIEDFCFLGANTIVVRGSINESTTIGKNSLLAPGCRIGHGTQIGRYVHFANNVITGGNTSIGDYSFIGSSAVFRPKVKLHEHTIVGAGAVVVKNTSKAGLTLMGVPASEAETKSAPSGMPKPKSK